MYPDLEEREEEGGKLDMTVLVLCEFCKTWLKCDSRTLFEVMVMLFRYVDKSLHAS